VDAASVSGTEWCDVRRLAVCRLGSAGLAQIYLDRLHGEGPLCGWVVYTSFDHTRVGGRLKVREAVDLRTPLTECEVMSNPVLVSWLVSALRPLDNLLDGIGLMLA